MNDANWLAQRIWVFGQQGYQLKNFKVGEHVILYSLVPFSNLTGEKKPGGRVELDGLACFMIGEESGYAVVSLTAFSEHEAEKEAEAFEKHLQDAMSTGRAL